LCVHKRRILASMKTVLFFKNKQLSIYLYFKIKTFNDQKIFETARWFYHAWKNRPLWCSFVFIYITSVLLTAGSVCVVFQSTNSPFLTTPTHSQPRRTRIIIWRTNICTDCLIVLRSKDVHGERRLNWSGLWTWVPFCFCYPPTMKDILDTFVDSPWGSMMMSDLNLFCCLLSRVNNS